MAVPHTNTLFIAAHACYPSIHASMCNIMPIVFLHKLVDVTHLGEIVETLPTQLYLLTALHYLALLRIWVALYCQAALLYDWLHTQLAFRRDSVIHVCVHELRGQNSYCSRCRN